MFWSFVCKEKLKKPVLLCFVAWIEDKGVVPCSLLCGYIQPPNLFFYYCDASIYCIIVVLIAL
jgi:hypothetical protein